LRALLGVRIGPQDRFEWQTAAKTTEIFVPVELVGRLRGLIWNFFAGSTPAIASSETTLGSILLKESAHPFRVQLVHIFGLSSSIV